VSRHFKHAIVLTLVPAVFMSLVAGGCLLIVHRPGAFVWVIVVSFSAAAICPLLAILALIRITNPKISLVDLIVCAVVSLLAAVLFNVALKSGIQEISGRHLSSAGSRVLWLNLLGWVMGIIELARFVSALPEAK
jgi:hypothetical protein